MHLKPLGTSKHVDEERTEEVERFKSKQGDEPNDKEIEETHNNKTF